MSAADDGGKGRGQKGHSEDRQPALEERVEAVGGSDVVVEEEVWESGRVVLGLYEVEDELGRGGMGVVHKVRHRSWNYWMAVKSPRPEALRGVRGKEQFVSEAELWVNLPAHPNIVTCHYVRTIAGIPRLFAEYVDGGSLKDRIAGGQLTSLESILDIAIQMAWGLAVAHGEGLVHQDMKPGNVMLTGGGTAKITDFGLARARARATGGEVAGDAAGDVGVSARGKTTEYASPEQMAGERLTVKTDIWSWAVTVLDMFVGGVSCELGPAAGWTLEEYLKRGPEDGLPAMPEGLAGLLRRCFASEPEERPGDFEGIAKELREVYREATGEAHPREVPQKVDFLADGLNNRALSMLDLGREDEAERLWQEALEADPTNPESTYNFGLRRWRNAETDDMALVHRLQEICLAHEGEWLPQYLLALVHLERDDTESAIATLEAIPQQESRREEVMSALEEARGRFPGRHLMRTFEGHVHRVDSICFSHDDEYALSSSAGKLKLWKVATGQCVRTFEGHASLVTSVCLSHDDKYALSGSRDKTLKLWKVATGRCVRTFEGHVDRVNSVCFSHDDKYALSGSADKTLKLWDAGTGECTRTFAGHAGGWMWSFRDSVRSVHLSHDDKYALSGSADLTVKLWDVATGECLRTFVGHKNVVESVCLSNDGRYALSGGYDDSVKLWDVATGKCVRTFEGHHGSVYSACLSHDSKYALSGSSDKTLKLWKVATGQCVRTFEGHVDLVKSVCFSQDGKYALSGSLDGIIELWNLTQTGIADIRALPQISVSVPGQVASDRERKFETLLAQSEENRKRGACAEAARLVQRARVLDGYQRNKKALAAVSALYRSLPRSKLLNVWLVRTFEGHTCGWVNSVCLSHDGKYAFSASEDSTLRLWDVGTGKCLRILEGHEGQVFCVCVGHDGKYALSGGDDQTVKLWDVATGECVRTLEGHISCNVASGECVRTSEGHTSSVISVCFSPDETYALSGGDDKTLRLWDVATGECVRTFEGHVDLVNSVCFSHDGKYALSASEDYTLRLWDVATGERLRTFEGHHESVYSACLSRDDKYALSGGDDKTLRLWDVATGECVRTFEGHADGVRSVCLSHDGKYALSGGYEGTLKLWDVSAGECVCTFEGHVETVISVCLGADGRYALSGSNDGTVKLWFLDWELEEREPADWDEGARPHLETFLTLHTPYLAELPQDREPTEEEVTLALTRGGRPQWTEDDFRGLLYTLGCAGYGWLRPEGVRGKLEGLAQERSK